jgi:hypothetical protein
MPRIVMDEVLREKLQGADHGLEIADEQGNVVGHFLAEDSMSRLLEAMFPPLTAEERAEARKEMREHGGLTTEQVLESIRDARRRWDALQ